MLLKIRDKVHGIFASVVLVFICVLFGLWGIQNYLGGGKETPIVSVGDKDFFQNDVNQAYQQFAQSLAGMKVDEETIRKQALSKLIRDEVLLQDVQNQNLLISDEDALNFIKTLEYFQKDGKFDKSQFQTLVASQGLTTVEFINRIKKALLMEQFQRSIVESSFVTRQEVDAFFKIQNQKRDIEFVNIPLKTDTSQPSDEEITSYYQQHQDAYQTEEQVSISYVELALDKLSSEVQFNDEQLKVYYEEQKGLYTTKERRRISHILFSFNKDTTADQQALEKALNAKEELKTKDFGELAAVLSDDKTSAKKGGDLGLFNVGVMEKSFEDAVEKLKLNEVSEPVKSAFGYHLIKVTELMPAEEKPYESIKSELIKNYQKTQAETQFNALAEKLTEVSYENPDNLNAAAKILGVDINKTGLFSKSVGEGVAADEKVRLAAFSEDVLKGNNSEPIEIGGEKLVVLRMESHLPSSNKDLNLVKVDVIKAIQLEKARQQAIKISEQIKSDLIAGKSFGDIANNQHLELKNIKGLARYSTELTPLVNQAVFKAAKPQNEHPTVIVVDDIQNKIVVSINKVTEGTLSETDKTNLPDIGKRIASAFGKAEFEAVLNALQANAKIVMHTPKQ